jgi:hypothetical protein
MQAATSDALGSSISSQVLTGIALVVLLYIVMATGEYLYNNTMALWKDKVELFPDTYASGSKMYTAIQNPSSKYAKTIYTSNNQRSGMEFSYSMFVYLASSTFASGQHYLYHILHKGYSNPYPLLGPGIFAWGDVNTLRVYMNCYNTWNNYTEVENIPVDRWFHLVVQCKGNTMYIYINGSLKKKFVSPSNTPPYQNFGNVYVFNSRIPKSLSNTTTQSLNGSSLTWGGAAGGMISRVIYFGYALSYTEIQSLMSQGPSTTMAGTDMTITPYLSDTWWTNSLGP